MVERILGKAEVGSSILPGGTMETQSKSVLWVSAIPDENIIQIAPVST